MTRRDHASVLTSRSKQKDYAMTVHLVMLEIPIDTQCSPVVVIFTLENIKGVVARMLIGSPMYMSQWHIEHPTWIVWFDWFHARRMIVV
jgi:hypothetical protein